MCHLFYFCTVFHLKHKTYSFPDDMDQDEMMGVMAMDMQKKMVQMNH